MYLNDILKRLKDGLPYIALLSIAAYTTSIMFQIGYYQPFGIDLFILTPRVDPTSLLTIITTFFGIIFCAAELAILNAAQKSNKLRPAVVEDVVFLVILFIFFFSYTANINHIADKDPYHLDVYGMGFVFFSVYLSRAIRFKRTYSATHNIRQAYIDTSILKFPKTPPLSRSVTNIYARALLKYLPAIMLFVIVTAIFPFICGGAYASNRSHFTSYPSTSKATIQVVVGESSEGFVLKTYNLKADKYEEGWTIIKSDKMTFEPTVIKSIQDQHK